MAFEDLRDRLQSELKNSWERLQESPLFIKLKENYENLTPSMQKLTLAVAALLITFLVLSIPFGYYSTSSDYVTEFQDKRQLIRDLLKVSRETQDAPNLPVPPDVATLRAQVDSQLQAARLLPEQIRGTEIASEKSGLIPGALSQGMISVSLAQLNLRQVVDLGHQLQSINPSVKMTDLIMEANAKDARYFDVIYKLVVLAVPSQVEAVPEPPPPPPKKRSR